MSFPGLKEYRDRHGRLRRYHRPSGTKLPADCALDDPRFLAAWLAVAEAPRPKIRPGTMADILRAYQDSTAFRDLAPLTRQNRAAIIKRMEKAYGALEASALTNARLSAMLGKLGPHAANNWLRVLRPAFCLAVETGRLADNPIAASRKRRTPQTGGHHAWTADELDAFRDRWPVGTKQRLAFDLALHTCQGRAEIARMGRHCVQEGMIVTRRGKTGVEAVCVIEGSLVDSLAAVPPGQVMFLLSSRGRPFSAASLGNWFADAVAGAKLPARCTLHGLRKAGLIRHAERGATHAELMAIAGHLSPAQTSHYIAAARKRVLARKAAERLRSV